MPTLLRLTLTETRLFFRDATNWPFVLLLPLLLLGVLGAIPSFREPVSELGGLRVIDLYPPVVVALGLTLLATSTLPQQLAGYREKGVLRRMRTTPVRPTMLLGAQLLMCAAMAAATTLAVLAIARLVFAVELPANPAAYVLAFLLAAVAMLAIGLLVAALAPSGASAGAIGLVLFFPLAFFAGLWIPRDSMSETLRTISDLTPLGAGVQSLQDAATGDWPQPLHLVVLLAWATLAGTLAARSFRWE